MRPVRWAQSAASIITNFAPTTRPSAPPRASTRAPGRWVAVSGNCFGLSLADAKTLGPEDFARRRARAYDVLYGAGAHYVVDSVADLRPVVALIEGRLARGERP